MSGVRIGWRAGIGWAGGCLRLLLLHLLWNKSLWITRPQEIVQVHTLKIKPIQSEHRRSWCGTGIASRTNANINVLLCRERPEG